MGIIKSIHNRWLQTNLMLRIILLFGVGIAYSQEDCMGMDNDTFFCTDEDFVNSDTLKKSIRITKRCQNIEVHFKLNITLTLIIWTTKSHYKNWPTK